MKTMYNLNPPVVEESRKCLYCGDIMTEYQDLAVSAMFDQTVHRDCLMDVDDSEMPDYGDLDAQ